MGWVRRLFRRRRMEGELAEEIREHLEEKVEELVAGGAPREEAEHAARREFGNLRLAEEDSRNVWRWQAVEDFLSDLRYAWRRIRTSPGFSAVVVLTLALGIGANTAIFTLIDAVLLKMLPVRNPQELKLLEWASPAGREVHLWMDGSSWPENGGEVGTPLPYPAFREIRARNEVLTDVFAFAELGSQMNVVADGEPGLAHGLLASGSVFTTLGVRPSAGRLFTDEDDTITAAPICVISDNYWKRRFGSNPHTIGKHITLAGVPFTIVGVTEPDFFGLQTGSPVEIWVPLSKQPQVLPNLDPEVDLFAAEDRWWVIAMGRLKPGVSAEQAQADLDVIFHPVAARGVSHDPDRESAVPSLQLASASTGVQELQRKFSRPLFILMILVGVVLLIACANVANLLFARANSRRKEIGVRLALGASRGRVIRQLLTESAVLASMGGAAGYLLARWGSGLLVTLISPVSDPLWLDLRPDARVLAFTILASVSTGLLFGLAPAWRATRPELIPALKLGENEAGSGRVRFGLRNTLVAFQVALSVVLLVGASLFVRTLINLKNVETGFDKENVLLFGVNPTKSGYKESALKDFYSEVQQRVAALPGVVSATASFHLLLGDGVRRLALCVPGRAPIPGDHLNVDVLPVGPSFLSTMKIELLRGRDLSERDGEHAPKVVLINEAFAKQYFSHRDPLGERIGLNDEKKLGTEIVGIVKNAKYDTLREATRPTVYQPIGQASDIPYMYFEVRTAMNPLALVPAVREAVATIDRNVPVFGVRTENEQINELLLDERLFAQLTSFFGAVALFLACAGLYGTLSYAVSRRTNEIGVRVALGASGRNISKMVMWESSVVILAGLCAGLPVAVVASRLVSEILFGLSSLDAISYAGVSFLLCGVGLLASYVPARRATRVDPMVALRYE